MRTAKVERDLASQAGLWYNKLRNNVVLGGAVNTPSRINPTGRSIMATLPPYADHGNPSHIPNASGIYKIICTANKRIYIGSTVNLRQRKNEHWSDFKRNQHPNRHLQRAWNKYGEQAFIFEVLEQVLTISLTAREQYWLNKLKPFGHKGFNIAREAGSTLGYKDSPERIEQKRQSMLGNTHGLGKNLGNKNDLGHSHKQSLETREKIRQAKRGHNNSPDHNEKVRQANLGKKQSLETIEKRRQAHLESKRSPEARERMRQANLARWARAREEK